MERSEHKSVAEFTPTPIMYYVYIIKSKKDSKLLYIGFTNNLKRRIEYHNKGLVSSTGLRRPFILVYFEAYISETDARTRESNLKLRSRAFEQLKKRIQASISV